MDSGKLLIGLGLVAAAGGMYYFFVYKPKQLPAPAPGPGQTVPPYATGQTPPGIPPAPPPPQAQVPPISSLTIPVTLKTSFQAADLASGLYRTFQPGQVVNVFGQPLAGITTFADTDNSPPHVYTTQSLVAGYAHQGYPSPVPHA